MLSGDNGILQKATTAKTETEKGQEREILALAYNSALAKKVSSGDSTAVTASDLNEELTNQGATADGSNPITVTFTDSKRQYTVYTNGKIDYAGIKNDYDSDEITITPKQDGSFVSFTVDVTGNKSIEDATEQEKLNAILVEWEKNNWFESSDERTTDCIKNYLLEWAEQNGTSYEEELQKELDYDGIFTIGEVPEISVTLGDKNIALLNSNSFLVTEDGTYKIEARTSSGKYGKAEITANVYMASITIHDNDTGVGDTIIEFPLGVITTWSQLEQSSYSSGLQINMLPYENNPRAKLQTPCLVIDSITYYVCDENGQLSINDTPSINLDAYYYWKKY
ncbi:MAG: hypothetical protein IJ629_03935 [Clostridia bacterium]|nr:hypothetical protein [Clostridia bacterium]